MMRRISFIVLALILAATVGLALAEETEGVTLVECVNYCEVLDAGEVVTAIRLEFSEPIAMHDLFPNSPYDNNDYRPAITTNVARPITRIYTNTTGVKGDVESQGQFIFVEFDNSIANGAGYRDILTFSENSKRREFIRYKVFFMREITTVNGNVIAPQYFSTSRDVRVGIDDYTVIKWQSAAGDDYDLLLYIPEGYDGTEAFPLVVHFTNNGDANYWDYSGNRLGGLFNHTDVLTWSSPESQAQFPSFVLAFGKDSSVSIDADVQMQMVRYILDNYNVDTNRIYAVSLAGATPRMFETILANPDVFAAAVYCAYDPLHVYRDMDAAIENYTQILSLMPTWAVAGETDHTGTLSADVVPPEIAGYGKGSRLANFSLMLNEQHGTNITVAGENGDMPMWNGWLRGDAATALADELIALAEAKGSDDIVSIFIGGTTVIMDHFAWANGYTNMGLHRWLFSQSK